MSAITSWANLTGDRMGSVLDIPEIRGLDGRSDLIRIPSQIDVPVTERVKSLIDAPEFQRLKKISQLGMVSFVYPAATHSRFEHSLGVYRNSLLFLRQFAEQPEFNALVTVRDAEILILASLLHDIGHWPYCHPIEDIELEGIPSHESFATRYLERDSISERIRDQWEIEPSEVLAVINRKKETPAQAILSSILSGPIDIDKMDYLYRDSLHAGVPYGQNFDSLRLIRSLCLNEKADSLAITDKGRTAAELMVFARYVMFSEVYWHHTVRSATTMFQRAFYRWHQMKRSQVDFVKQVSGLFESGETEMIRQMRLDLEGESAAEMLDQLFGVNRRLHKRAANFSFNENAATFEKVAYHPYSWLVATSERLTELIAEQVGVQINKDAVLIDAPPVGLEVQFNVDVYSPKTNAYRPLGEVSPVVNTLAKRQFDDFVKQVRVFVEPGLLPLVEKIDLELLLVAAAEN
ncbi:HD domain-containing protein [Mariniblastus sp.]|nr:HD domain-containing protein [Mariniblastus sp.]MDB4545107.1 HD domain-containing protein [bacterium]